MILKIRAEFLSSITANTIVVQMPLPKYTTRYVSSSRKKLSRKLNIDKPAKKNYLVYGIENDSELILTLLPYLIQS